MKKNEILEELKSLNPEIEESKIEEIFNNLYKSNPKIKINKDFKKSLKKELENIWNYKKIWRFSFFSKNLVYFLLPLVWVIWVFTLFWIFWQNLWKNNISTLKIETWSSTIISNSWKIDEKSSKREIKEFSVSENFENVIYDENFENNNSEKNKISDEKIQEYAKKTNIYNEKEDLKKEAKIEKKLENNFEKNQKTKDLENINFKNYIKKDDSWFAWSIKENNLNWTEFQDNYTLKDYSVTSWNSLFENNWADDTEFNRRVLEKTPVYDLPKYTEMKYLDEPNLVNPTINYDSKTNLEIKNSINVKNIDSSEAGKIIQIWEFEQSCKKSGFIYWKKYSRNFCKFSEKICFEDDYYAWKCKFLK